MDLDASLVNRSFVLVSLIHHLVYLIDVLSYFWIVITRFVFFFLYIQFC